GHGQIPVEGSVLGEVADATAHFQGLAEHVESRHGGAAARGRHEAREDLHGGGLACAVGAEESHDLSLVDGEGHVVDGRHRPIALSKLVSLDHWIGGVAAWTIAQYITRFRTAP